MKCHAWACSCHFLSPPLAHGALILVQLLTRGKPFLPLTSPSFFFLLALDFKVDPLGRPRFLILVGSLKGEDNKHSLPLGSGNRWKEKNPLYDFFSCFQCQNWPEVTMCCYNMLCTNAIVECPGPKIKTWPTACTFSLSIHACKYLNNNHNKVKNMKLTTTRKSQKYKTLDYF